MKSFNIWAGIDWAVLRTELAMSWYVVIALMELQIEQFIILLQLIILFSVLVYQSIDQVELFLKFVHSIYNQIYLNSYSTPFLRKHSFSVLSFLLTV